MELPSVLEASVLEFSPVFESAISGIVVGGTPKWLQDEEIFTCSCGAEMHLIGQISENYGFPKTPSAPEQPDSFSADDYCLFLGNETYIFGCTAQCDGRAVWIAVQN